MLGQLLTTAIAAKFATRFKGMATPDAWDQELIAREIETHREAIALYKDKANGSDAQLRVFAGHILPHLQQHLARLESLQSESRHARR